jgi:hypothetical protein
VAFWVPAASHQNKLAVAASQSFHDEY